jgi:ABC-type transporter Mla maintaining outer membrane lipid asymmetry ATPase subunit MlaF
MREAEMQNDKMLEFSNVRLDSLSDRMSVMSNINFSIMAGEIVIVLLESDKESEYMPLFDLAEGMIDPDEGSITFMGERWPGMLPWRQSEMRGKIGRVFPNNGWVSNLTIYENIALSERHHTSRKDVEIREEIEQLCRFVGLSSIPYQRPDSVAMSVLRKSEWVRAFIGNHMLLLLESPEHSVHPEDVLKLFELVSTALLKHSAVIWTTVDQQIWETTAFLNKIRRYKMYGGRLLQVEATP